MSSAASSDTAGKATKKRPRATTAANKGGRSPSPYQVEGNTSISDFVQEFWQHTVNVAEGTDDDFKHQSLPLARIKKVMRTDPDVKMISSEVTVLFEKACQIFISEITARARLVSLSASRKTLNRTDVSQAIAKSDTFDFLIDIVPREEPGAAAAGDAAAGGSASGSTRKRQRKPSKRASKAALLKEEEQQPTASASNTASPILNGSTWAPPDYPPAGVPQLPVAGSASLSEDEEEDMSDGDGSAFGGQHKNGVMLGSTSEGPSPDMFPGAVGNDVFLGATGDWDPANAYAFDDTLFNTSLTNGQ